MVNNMVFEIKDIGPINNAKMNIGKINIIGGPNSSGKSTLSKLLYCFLRANSSDRKDLVVGTISEKLDEFGDKFDKLSSEFENNPQSEDLVPKVAGFCHTSFRLNDFKSFAEEFRKIEITFNQLIYPSEDNLKIIEYNDKLNKYRKDCENLINEKEDFSDEINLYKSLIKKYENLINIENNKGFKTESNNEFEITNPAIKELYDEFNKIKESFKLAEENNKNFFERVMSQLLSSELDIGEDNGRGYVSLYDGVNSKFNYSIDFNDFEFNWDGWFDINKVFYLESYSIYDTRLYGLPSFISIPSMIRGKASPEHFDYLENHLFSSKSVSKIFDDIYNQKLIELEKNIHEIIGGSITKGANGLKYQTDDYSCSIKNTASGVKQISILQTLLKNRSLQPNSFLIMDEPEVNLHPEWQLKFAQILVLIAKDLDINIYVNSHSPLFIEAINIFSKLYEISEDVNYYLTEPINDSIQFNCRKVPSNDLSIIYENLGQPYDNLDILKIRMGFK